MQEISPAAIEVLSDLQLPPFRTVYDLPFGIQILASSTGGAITSELQKQFGGKSQGSEAAIALESLLLAMACQGIDVSTIPMKAAVEKAVTSIAHLFVEKTQQV